MKRVAKKPKTDPPGVVKHAHDPYVDGLIEGVRRVAWGMPVFVNETIEQTVARFRGDRIAAQ